MGLAGLGTEGSTPPTGELAQLMQDVGTNDQNADILNLYLASSDLLVGAPPPIQAASTTEPVQSLVFNSNFTRERYGKASVNDKISLESDRISLLLDSNQSDAQKALSLISSLEFSNGLSAVQNMSDGDVTGTTVTNLDTFSSLPDDIFTNTAQLNDTKRQHLVPAFTGAAESDFIDAMVRQAGGTPGPTSFSAVVSDQTLMSQIAADAVASAMLSMHPNGAPEAASSQTAMQELAASQTAMQELVASQTAMTEIDQVDFAVRAIMCGTTSQDPTSFADADAVSQDATAMAEIAGNATTMNTIVASQTAMQEVANSQTAMTQLLSTDGTVESIMSNTLVNSSIAEQELDNSTLNVTRSGNYGDQFDQAAGTNITNTRMLVTSNNKTDNNTSSINGAVGVEYAIAYGPETEEDTTFVINAANIANNGNATNSGGSFDITGIEP